MGDCEAAVGLDGLKDLDGDRSDGGHADRKKYSQVDCVCSNPLPNTNTDSLFS